MKRERAEVAELEAHVSALEKQQATTRENFVRKDDEIEELKKKIITRRGGARVCFDGFHAVMLIISAGTDSAESR